MPTNRHRFTKAWIQSLKPADKRQYFYDTGESALGLYVTPAGTKTFFAKLYIDGGIKRRPVGKFGAITLPRARRLASEAKSELARTGVDPLERKRRHEARSVTLAELLDAYIAARSLKPGTIADYRRAIRESFGDWLNKPLADITSKMVLARYQERGKTSKARTDNAARVLKALFTFARATYKGEDGESLFPINPTNILGEAKVRFRPKRRQTKLENISEWWRAVTEYPNPPMREYLQFLILTGCRRTEALNIEWPDIDWRAGTFTLRDTKNRKPVTLPLPLHIKPLLLARREQKGRVFPFAEPRPAINAVRKASGQVFRLHDLRRTFVSAANSLDISAYTVKALVNHTLNASDVTAGYDVPDMARLRKASARIEDEILRLAGERTADVVVLRR